MTFAIEGPMDRPQVIVNPLAMLAPGIFREIFQMTPFDPKVQRRDEAPTPAAEENVRPSKSPRAKPQVLRGSLRHHRWLELADHRRQGSQ